MDFYTPILLHISKSPENAWRIFEVIRNIKPPRLFLSSEPAFTVDVEKMSKKVDWKCEVLTSVTSGSQSPLAWFFNSIKDEGIVVKDDCLPDASFFYFCDAMVERYRAKRSVLTVSGVAVTGARAGKTNHSYFFTNRAVGNAWGSWKRAWESNGAELEALFADGAKDWADPKSMTVVPKSNLIDHKDGVPVVPLKFPLEHQIIFKMI